MRYVLKYYQTITNNRASIIWKPFMYSIITVQKQLDILTIKIPNVPLQKL